jgi:hypothetical protein
MHVLLALLVGASCSVESYLYQPAFCIDHQLRGPARCYRPQPGDIVLMTNHTFFGKISHRVGLTAAPQHSGLVVARRDGQLVLLEADPYHTLRCQTTMLMPTLIRTAQTERVWIRARRTPLTEEQNRRLTEFAVAVEGRYYSVGKLLKQSTPFRHRGPLRTEYFGKPRAVSFSADGSTEGVKRTYFCSELVLEALVAARAVDPTTIRPSATYPRDLFFERSINRYLDEHLRLCDWDPPARWTRCPGTEPILRSRPWLDGDGLGPRRR